MTGTAATPAIIELAGVEKTYRSGGRGGVGFRALGGVDLAIAAGEMVAITGPSGSGKTTIINLIAGIDRPTAGTVTVNGSRLDQMTEEQLAVWRGRTIGIVFQFFQLMPTLTAAENATLPLDLARLGPARERKAVASRHLATVGLGDRGDRLPLELSGGEQQRVAIARAMACGPPILLGDEPTGNLDTQLAQDMFRLLKAERRRDHRRVRHARPGPRRAGLPDRVGPRRADHRRHGPAAVSTLNRKAWGDLTRHRARTLLAVCTLSIAIASLGFLAVPSLLNAAMNRQIAESHLNDVGISTNAMDLTPAQLSALGHLPGVAAVSPALGYTATATSAAGTRNVAIAGGDLASAPVNTVPLLSGRLPGPGEVLADAGNARAADFPVPVGGTIDVRAASGRMVRLRVSGTGMNLAATPGANGSTTPVFYATHATVESLRGVRGYNYLGLRLTDDTAAAQSRVIAEVRAYLTAQTGTDPITALPAVRAPGQWPGQSGFSDIMALLYIITILAFLSALFLISATMNTLIAEQAGEIAILKTLGGRRRQIAGITVRTAAMLGAAGAVAGTILGIAIAYLLARYFAVKLIDVSFGFGISVPVVVASLVLGPALAVAASLPALRRALRRPVAETLAGAGTSGYGSGWLDRLVARSGLLAGAGVPGSVRMGVRNALRQKRRSAATIAQVAVAAGLAIAFLALGQSVTAAIGQTIGKLHFSFGAGEAPASGARPFTGQALAVAASTPGVTGAEPVETSSVQYNGQTYAAWGLGTHPLYSYRLSAGRWFTAADTAGDARTASRRWCSAPPSHAPPAPGSGRSSPSPGRRTHPGPRHRDRHRRHQRGADRLLPVAGAGTPRRHARRRELDLAHHRQFRPRRHRPGDHRRREPAGRRRVPGQHHRDLRHPGADHRSRDLDPHHRGDPGPGGGGHHAHGPGQRPQHGRHRAHPGGRHPALRGRPGPPDPAGLQRRGGGPGRRRLGVRSPDRLADLPGAAGAGRPLRRPHPAPGIPAGHPADHAGRRARAHAPRDPRAAAPRHPDPARRGPPVPVIRAVG